MTPDIAGVNFLKDTLGDFLEDGVAKDLETIMTSVDAVKSADFKIVFDPTLSKWYELLYRSNLRDLYG